jgi:hypothetical protein
VLHSGRHGQHGKAVTIRAQAPASVEHALAVFPQDLETALFLNAKWKE